MTALLSDFGFASSSCSTTSLLLAACLLARNTPHQCPDIALQRHASEWASKHHLHVNKAQELQRAHAIHHEQSTGLDVCGIQHTSSTLLSVHCSCMIGRLQETRGKLSESAILLGSCPRTCTSSHRALLGKTAAMNYYIQENSVLAVRQWCFLLVSGCLGLCAPFKAIERNHKYKCIDLLLLKEALKHPLQQTTNS